MVWGGSEAGVVERTRENPRLVSVILPCRDAARTLSEQLGALSRQTYQGPCEIVLVDNGSTDDTLGVAHRWCQRMPHLRVVSVMRRGLNAARNEAARVAAGDLLVVCDGDDVVDESWVENLVASARHFDLVAGRLDPSRVNSPEQVTWR